MVFPQTPRDVFGELYVNDDWITVTSDILQKRDRLSIGRGRRDESGSVTPSSCSLTLKNRTGNYSPMNPVGAYYGTFGRNTLFRTGIRDDQSGFTGTVSNGWGATDSGQSWTHIGAGGSVLSSDFQQAGGAATHSVPTDSAYRLSYLGGRTYQDVEITITASLAITDVTGGNLEPGNLILRVQSTTDYYMLRVAVTTAEAITLSFMHYDGTVIAAAVTIDGLTHTSSQPLRIRMQAEGQTLRAKIWAVGSSEPADWQLTAHSELIDSAGWVAIRSGVAPSNSNTKPVTFSYDDLEIRRLRFSGEISSVQPTWDVSGEDVITKVEANGILRRLGQGASPIQSSLKRGLSSMAPLPVAYWPCEDGKNSTIIASGLPGGTPMYVYGNADFAASTVFAASDPLPYPKASYWIGYVPPYTVVDRQQVRFLLGVPDGGLTAQTLIATATTGTLKTWLVRIDATGALNIRVFDAAATLVLDTVFVGFAVNGSPRWVALEYEQVGSDVTTNLVTLEPGAATGLQMPLGGYTIAGQTVGITASVQVGSLGDTTVGHVSIHNKWSSLFALGDQLAGYDGETAGRRLGRLCLEQGIDFSYTGSLDDTAPMGPQRSGTLVGLLAECEDADLGILYEPAGTVGISYRTLASLYNQGATFDLDYSLKQVSSPFQPVDDDALSRNDIAVKRTDGSEYHVELQSGPMSTLPVGSGGIGRYAASFTVNVYSDDQLPDIAGMLLNLGTVQESRYKTISVDLSNPSAVAANLERPVLDLAVGSRFTISNPKAIYSPDQISQLALGWTESIQAFEHRLELNCAPASPYNVAIMDDGHSRIDSSSSTLDSGITDSATTMDVAWTEEGDDWTTDSGEMPFSIMVGGEEMSVTAISGSSSPQTFTVTRSANGVVKPHASGTEVHVKHPVVITI